MSGLECPNEHLQRDEIAPGLPEEAVGEAVSELVGERGRTPARRRTRSIIRHIACSLAGRFGSLRFGSRRPSAFAVRRLSLELEGANRGREALEFESDSLGEGEAVG